MKLQKKNFSAGILHTALNNSDLTMVVDAGHSLPTTALPFRAIVWDYATYPIPATDPNVEIVTATYSSANTYTIVRAEESTLASSHPLGAYVVAGYTAGVLDEANIDHDSLMNFSADEHFIQTAITKVSSSLATGFLKVATGTGDLSSDTNTYLTGNQTINLSGDVSGSGTTSIEVTVADDSHNHTSATLSGIDLTTDVGSSVLPIANGGTNKSTWTANQIVYASATNVLGQSSNLTFDGTTLSTVKGAFTQTTGTAPFTVASTTKVTNLNADRLDDAHVGTSGTAIPLLNTANTWNAKQVINISAGGSTISKALDVMSRSTDTSGQLTAFLARSEFLPSGTSSAACYGLYVVSDIVSATTANITGFQAGLYFDCFYRGQGTLANQFGIAMYAGNIGSGTITNSYGIFANVDRQSTGSIGTAVSVRAVLSNRLTSTGNMTDGYFFRAEWNGDRVFLGTVYGLHIPDVTARGATVWSLYCAGGQSSHAGNFRIGSNVAPTVALDVTGATLISTTLGVTGLTTATGGIMVGTTNKVNFNDTGQGIYSQADTYLDIYADGAVRIGDSSAGAPTNYTKFESDGTLEFVGNATVWEDLRIEPVARTSGTNAPTFEKWFDDSGNTSRGVYLYSFDKAITNNQKEIFFTMQMPHAWAGTNISMHVHWVPFVTVDNTEVIWGLEYCWKEIGADFGDTTIVYSSGTLVPDDANITINRHYISEFSDLVPGTSADGLSSILIGRLFRYSGAASDTYTNKVGLLYIDAHYEVNTCGSRSEYSK